MPASALAKLTAHLLQKGFIPASGNGGMSAGFRAEVQKNLRNLPDFGIERMAE
jgi:hypothetical protein